MREGAGDYMLVRRTPMPRYTKMYEAVCDDGDGYDWTCVTREYLGDCTEVSDADVPPAQRAAIMAAYAS